MKATRTRIKICGLTRADDIAAAIELGADALGFVFYPASPRYIKPEVAAELTRHLPPFITITGLFVNAPRTDVQQVVEQVGLNLLQFHGDESEADCTGYGLPYIKAARIRPGLDLLEFGSRYPAARALLLDAFVEGYGGGGKVFDWSLIPKNLGHRIILSGGLNAENVAAALAKVRPYAVDVSSGVEADKGVKDHEQMCHFIQAVRASDGIE